MKTLLVLVLGLITAAANAQTFKLRKEVICGDSKDILSTLTGKDFKEVPLWSGTDPESETRFVLMVNHDDTSWTIVQYTKNTACILGTGEGFRINSANIGKIKTKL